jgi:hypothetical protein
MTNESVFASDAGCAADAVRSALKQAVEAELVSVRVSSGPEAFSRSSFSKSHGIFPESTYSIHFAEADSVMLRAFADELAAKS